LREAHPRFGPESKIVYWGGGVWNWLDPLTLVRAWPDVNRRWPEARLVFPRTQPNPAVPPSQKALEIERLAEALGARDQTIFFLDWLSYEKRESLLCEADVGVVLHPSHIETHFAVRTRVMDYVWAGLPILTTAGDVMSDVVCTRGLGYVVPPLDPEAVAQALNEILSRPKSDWSAAFKAYAEEVRWSKVVEPIRRYCFANVPAPDRVRRATLTTLLLLKLQASFLVRALKALQVYGWRVALTRLAQLVRGLFSST
jgi:glycosyltransferase involved in cell wall biosynthesis